MDVLELAANPLGGRILSRRGGKDLAYEISQPRTKGDPVPTKPLPAPRSGWNELWSGLSPLMDLKDEGDLPPDDVWVADGETSIVEIAVPGRYRTYHHSNPEFHKSRPDAMTLVRITRWLDAEFAGR